MKSEGQANAGGKKWTSSNRSTAGWGKKRRKTEKGFQRNIIFAPWPYF